LTQITSFRVVLSRGFRLFGRTGGIPQVGRFAVTTSVRQVDLFARLSAVVAGSTRAAEDDHPPPQLDRLPDSVQINLTFVGHAVGAVTTVTAPPAVHVRSSSRPAALFASE
ncbi:unnamed protein product, partial [Ixodes pacificus]